MKKFYQFCQIFCAVIFLLFSASSVSAQVVVTSDNPFNEGFEATGLGSWTTEAIVGNDVWVDTYAVSHTGGKSANFSSSLFGDFLNIDPDDPMAMIQLMMMMTQLENIGNGSARLISPVLDLSNAGGQVSLTFYRKHTSLMIPQILFVYYRTSPSSQWIFLQQYNSGGDWAQETLVLPSPSATYQIAFEGLFNVENMGDIDIMSFMDPDASMNFSSDIYIDDVTVGVTVSCPTPQNLTMSNVSTTSATATWSSTASSWTLEIGPAGFSHGNGTIYIAQNPTYTFTGLTPNTTYDVYVRANCSGDITSSWAQTSFTASNGSGIAENESGFLTVSPNPTTDVVRCSLNNLTSNTRLQVLDVYGKLLMEQPVTEATTELDFSDKAAGIYFLRVITDNQVVTTQKVIRR